jgi:beta-lactamase class A
VSAWATRRAALAGLAVVGLTGPAHARPPSGLQTMLEAAADAAPGRLLVLVRDLVTGAEAGVRPDETAPMHSAVKLFVAAWAAGEVAAGRLSDSQTVALRRETSPTGSGRIDRALAAAGLVAPTVAEMIEAVLLDSDNAATDGLISLAPSPAAIGRELRLGPAVRIARTQGALYAEPPRTQAEWDAFLADPRDQATPRGFVDALGRLSRGQLAGPVADARVRALMEQAPVGAARLTAGLGPDWRVQGRTGTGMRFEARRTSTNQAALAIHRRTGRTIAIAALLKDAGGGDATRDAAIARVGAAVRNAWPDG